MSMDQLLATVARLNASLEALAVVAADLRIEVEAIDADDEIRERLAAISALVLPEGALDDLDANQKRAALAAIRAFFLQAAELIDDPGRGPGWAYEDPLILQSQGQASAMVPMLIQASMPHMPGAPERLAAEGATFLDIGCGVAALSISACQAWPAVSVVGVDPWKVSMEIARANVGRSPVADRIELLEHGIEDLDHRDRYDLAWLPGPFLPPEILPTAVATTRDALAPGGWVVFGLYAGPDDPLATALMHLRIRRSGGQVLSPDDAATLLRDGGFESVTVVPRTWQAPMQFVVGQRAPG